MTWLNVDFPEPFGPMMACTSPLFTVSESPWRISRSSTRTCRSLTSNNDIRLNPVLVLCRLDPDALGRRIALVHDVAGIANACRLENDDLRLLVRGRTMFDAALYDHGFAGPEIDGPVTEFHAEVSFPDQKELVFGLVLMPGKLALDLYQLDLLLIQRRDRLGAPLVNEQSKLFVEVDLVGHRSTHAAFQRDRNQLLRLDCEFHRQLLQHVLHKAVDHEADGFLLAEPALDAIEQHVLGYLRGGRLVLEQGGGILGLDIGHGVRAAFVADQQRVAGREVAGSGCLAVRGDETAIGVLGDAGGDALGADPAGGVLARVGH